MYNSFLFFFSLPLLAAAIRWAPEHVGYNLNLNETATEPKDYWGEWENHTYHPSPSNWRFPFYALTLDRYIDGDPTNNEANETVFEHNWMSNQFRFGGDIKGLEDDLDYFAGAGFKGLYLTGSPFINMPWSGDGYGPLDFTLLDKHHGNIDDWRNLITAIHDRGMYVILDNTMATMGDLLAFEGHINSSTPFSFDEYGYVWKSDRRYLDFEPDDERNKSCDLPRWWGQDGYPLAQSILDEFDGCRTGEFDLYGDIKGTGSYPSYINTLSKFASVQDRLREWKPSVLEKIKVMSCIQIAMFDIDGFRMDKGLQTTVDAMAEFTDYQRQCAKKVGKDNLLIVGEIVGDPHLAAVYVGRGKQPNQYNYNVTDVMLTGNDTTGDDYIRDFGLSALDGSAFHYDVYGSLTRFLGLDSPWGSYGVDWVYFWNKFLYEHDFVNANTGLFDPRHMFGTTNQDVFRWPALSNGTQRQLLGLMVTQLELPGIPLILFGEEQEHYVLENTAADYVFGRTPFGSSRGWQLHGCYSLGEEVYVNMPFNSSGFGCHDDSVSLDHRNPAHPLRNVLKRMYELRRQYPTLNDGFNLTTLSNQTYDIYLPGSGGLPSPHGIWSVYRGRSELVQDFTGDGQGNQGIWFVYSNENKTFNFTFDCSADSSNALIAPWKAGTTVKNLFYPYEEYNITESSTQTFGLEGETEPNGCFSSFYMKPWDWKVLVPVDNWETPSPTITKFVPGHDSRLLSSVGLGQQETVDIELHFDQAMDCDSVTNSISVESTTQDGVVAEIDESTIECDSYSEEIRPLYVAVPDTRWRFAATLKTVSHGIHVIRVNNATSSDKNRTTDANDRFQFRIGQQSNPMVFQVGGNYSNDLLHHNGDGLYIHHKAAGADKFRYSLTWESSWSEWHNYTGENFTLQSQNWSGTNAQKWEGQHVVVNYWSKAAGSSEHMQHGDLNRGDRPARRWPHAFAEGKWNEWGYDGGLENKFKLIDDGLWKFDLVAEWPSNMMVNVWGMNPDGNPDKSAAYGDVDGDNVLDWLPPNSLSLNVINMTRPPRRYLGLRTVVNDGNFSYRLIPIGSAAIQIAVAFLLFIIPLITGVLGIWAFRMSFYQVKFNQTGVTEKKDVFDFFKPIKADAALRDAVAGMFNASKMNITGKAVGPAAEVAPLNQRRRVLIATMEYDIEDWNTKVKIGGLGVMASLMGKNLGLQDLIWVVPCIGDIEYPVDEVAEPMTVRILGVTYDVRVQYHQLRNITYVLLDAPVFRKQTRAEPYPARMDDLESSIYYSAWNQCIAQAITRFDVDLYHINDYHGAIAPLYLLPSTIPCCLSLHNAEFQGLWSLRTSKERNEISLVFNLENDVIEKYVQFGEVFNLLHAGASYLRVHQKGFGAVGVSKKYGKRSLMRYPIFWGLRKVGSLPNPDPSDTEPLNKDPSLVSDIKVDEEMERKRLDFRKQAQEWAGLHIDPTAELFVFVGRWSLQKGIDLIADVFFSLLERHPKIQLICVGPVIDLYGKFAALKLKRMMERYPGRVCSKPEFTVLPPYIFSGAEFALIPSRDEPFGLVAVEFGRKGALGVGARVGGLGQMPGWWYTVESTTTRHLLTQFKNAIKSALATRTATRAEMRARSLVQRFPVAQWVEDLETLQSTSIRISLEQQTNPSFNLLDNLPPSLLSLTPRGSAPGSRTQSPGPPGSRGDQRRVTPPESSFEPSPPSRTLTPKTSTSFNTPDSPLVSQSMGPGHGPYGRGRKQSRSRGESRSESIDSTKSRGRSRGRFYLQRTNTSSNLDVLEEARLSMMDSSDERAPYVPGSLPRDPRTPGTLSSRPSPWTNDSASSSDLYLPPPNPAFLNTPSTPDSTSKRLSMNTITGARTDYKLQNVDPFFTDTHDIYYKAFDKLLDNVNPKNAETSLCIEEFLVKSERDWFSQMHRAKLGMASRPSSRPGTPCSTTPRTSIFNFNNFKTFSARSDPDMSNGNNGIVIGEKDATEDFALPENYVAPNGIKKLLQKKVGDWQVYCLLLAVGQILAANSYQLSLLTGQVSTSATKLYILSTIYLVSTAAWWILYRHVQAVYCLASPILIYAIAILILGMGIWVPDSHGRQWVYNFSTALYGMASASGSLFFALNFGTEGGTATKSWAFRACVIQGTQQVYVSFLWYWGSSLTNSSGVGSKIASSGVITAITTPIAVILFVLSAVLFFGLPDYYRMSPGKVPSFYKSILNRKVVLWFFIMVLLQNYFLSGPYNRNWKYLWSSQHTPFYSIVLLVLVFFIGVWALALWILGNLSNRHSWIIPVFAISLGAPRWCQMLWSTSSIGLYIPWVWSSDTAGALLGRCIWLWLGVLDALQGVGFGMILLQTLTRFHVTFVLIAAQALGSLTTIIARASAPDRQGPGTVFPNFSVQAADGLKHAWFWIALICQLVICLGFLKVFRKEQLFKP